MLLSETAETVLLQLVAVDGSNNQAPAKRVDGLSADKPKLYGVLGFVPMNSQARKGGNIVAVKSLQQL